MTNNSTTMTEPATTDSDVPTAEADNEGDNVAKALATALNRAVSFNTDPDVVEPLARAASGKVAVDDNEGDQCILEGFHPNTDEFLLVDDGSDVFVHRGIVPDFYALPAP